MAATKQQLLLLVLAFISLTNTAFAAVLDDDRVDILYQSYDGGGANVKAPAIFMRKKMTEGAAISAHALSDMVSGASIDVEISGASAYEEQRHEMGIALELLKDKTIYNASFSKSTENDYDTQSIAASIKQDFFGDLSNLGISVSYADSKVGKTGDLNFSETAKQYSLSLSWAQILTKYMIASLTFNKSIDEGYLQNPYRFTRYRTESSKGWTLQFIGDKDDALAYGFPDVRSSEALALKLRYLISPDHALHGGFRYFQDSFKIKANNIDIGYNFRLQENWLIDFNIRYYQQTAAEFYSDIYERPNQTSFRTRDKELSTFNNTMFSISTSYDLPHYANWIKKSSVHAYIDHIVFNYDDFRDANAQGYKPGEEPLYQFSANLIRLMYSLWF